MSSDSELFRKFAEIGVVKFGDYMMKKDVWSPIYMDLRSIYSHPDVVRNISERIHALKQKVNIECDIICGVPYGALPIATCVSVCHNMPMIMRRKEAKDYGTKKILEGSYQRGQKCVVIEDVVSSGSSVSETVNVLRNEGLVVTDCICVIDRREGGRENLLSEGVTLHSLFEMEDITTAMLEMKLVPEETVKRAVDYLSKMSFHHQKTNLTFRKRAEKCTHPILKKLFTIMDDKKTNLCVAVDVIQPSELAQLADTLGPYICMLKTNVDTLAHFNQSVISSLRELSEKHNFLLFEDKKFADIGKTVQLQYSGGPYKICEWAHLVSCLILPGEGVVEGLKKASGGGACVLVADVGTDSNLIDEEYKSKTKLIADNHRDFVIGFISRSRLVQRSDVVHISPAVHLNPVNDPFGIIHQSPKEAVKAGCDIIIVGRGITKGANVVELAKAYKEMAYEAYLDTVIGE